MATDLLLIHPSHITFRCKFSFHSFSLFLISFPHSLSFSWIEETELLRRSSHQPRFSLCCIQGASSYTPITFHPDSTIFTSHDLQFRSKRRRPRNTASGQPSALSNPTEQLISPVSTTLLLLFNYRNPLQLMINVLLLFCSFFLEVVTMQAQRTAPPDFNCKDKFLVQSAVVPAGTTEDDISSDLVSHVYYAMLFSLFCHVV